MLEKLNKSPFIQHFKDAIHSETSLLFEGLWNCPKAILSLFAKKELGRTVVIITAKEKQDRLLDDINYFDHHEALEFPAWETLPSEDIKPNLDIVGKRFSILNTIAKNHTTRIVLAPLGACLQKVLPKETLQSLFHDIETKQELSFDGFAKLLDDLGYLRRPVTSDKGEYSVRGGIIDVFPISAFNPYRIDFFGDTVESIRSFDPTTQKSIEKVSKIFVSPADESLLLKKCKNPVSLFSYFENPPFIIFDDLLALEDKWVSYKNLPGFSSDYTLTLDDLLKDLNDHKKLYFTNENIESLSTVAFKDSSKARAEMKLSTLSFDMFNRKISTKRMVHPFAKIHEFFLSLDEDIKEPYEELIRALDEYKDHSLNLHFILSTDAEENTLRKQIEEHQITLPEHVHFERGYLSSGCVCLDTNTVLFPATELTNRYKVRRKKWRNTYHTPASDFHELDVGDLVVHFHNGIGKFLGIEKQKNHLGHVTEFIILEYASASKLYVPLSQSHLVSRYIGTKEESPTLHQLGTTKWQVAKAKAQKSIMGYAKDLLHLQAERDAKGGFVYPEDSENMLLFEEEFPFIETEDQLNGVASIKKDMESGKAMDRLVCGDVGYGKTEVAMRATFKAAHEGRKQVAVLVPTTTLAMQHYETFKERFANFPLNVKALSRFISSKESKQVLEGLKNGSVDIIIGTHRLISKDVAFKNLGMIIIDEEQRFGVRAKEYLKKAKLGVDCLTLSATPIPRTLYMSIIGARDLSVINTPPQDRLPIKTIIAETDSALIKNALLRELSRDGQAYYIHNRVESIHSKYEEIQKLVPSARISYVHGQMPAERIDEIFHAFKSGAVDILIATTIVESGIDIPNANTILIDRADRFGLADLYQLRGRVGRWNRPAYAYFLTPQNKELPELSRKRLQALVETSGFGGGMKLALRDLEIRGAGDILGVQQSGQVSSVGFHLYCKLLKRAVDAIKNKTVTSFVETKMEFTYPASLPEDYIPETSLRLEIYHRLGETMCKNELDNILKELEDRFGKPPSEVIWLYHLTSLRIFASKHSFSLLKFEKTSMRANRQKGKVITKKSLLIPEFDNPEELEKYVVMMLKHNFKIA
ncbi:MAG: Transcription-repair-coupling factor [Chlamydiia bacterium]|nr:Transcription-repair-coupling factor [Chlamydiia bacterium]